MTPPSPSPNAPFMFHLLECSDVDYDLSILN